MIRPIIAVLFLVAIGYLVVVIATDYQERMGEYNKYGCAVYGKTEDCKTPLEPQDRLK